MLCTAQYFGAIAWDSTPRPASLRKPQPISKKILNKVILETPFELLVPMPPQNSPKLHDQALSSERFNRRWAGYATAKEPFRLKQSRCPEPFSVSFSVTVNDQRIIISNPSWPPSTVTKSKIWLFIIHNAGISKSFSNSTKPWVGIGPVRSTSTSVTDK